MCGPEVSARTVALSTTQGKVQGANRTDAPFRRLPDAFHMTERETRKRDGQIRRKERERQERICSTHVVFP